MGMNLGNNNGNYRTQPTLSEINVTPLVDVMLVLLIVFMITAPLMQQGIQVDLPKAAAPTMDEQQEQIVLVINKDRKILINQNEISAKSLQAKLAAIYTNKSTREIIIQADQAVSYGFVAEVMAEVKRAGITKVGLVTEAPKLSQ
jgi:biopolymer transport protein TolR